MYVCVCVCVAKSYKDAVHWSAESDIIIDGAVDWRPDYSNSAPKSSTESADQPQRVYVAARVTSLSDGSSSFWPDSAVVDAVHGDSPAEDGDMSTRRLRPMFSSSLIITGPPPTHSVGEPD